MSKEVIISKNIPLSSRLKAKEIWVDWRGNITIVADQFGPNQEIPNMTLEYFDSLCSRFYYGSYTHQHAIADILLLNGYLHRCEYDEFYKNLKRTLEANRFTVVYSELLQ